MSGILRSSVPSPFSIFSKNPINNQYLKKIIFQEIKIKDKWDKNILDGYIKVNRVENPGEFSLIGDTYIIYLKKSLYCIRLELFGDKVDAISLLDNISLRKESDLEKLIFPIIDDFEEDFTYEYDLQIIPLCIINFFQNKSINIDDNYYSLPVYVGKDKLWEMDLKRFIENHFNIKYYGQNIDAFKKKIQESLHNLNLTYQNFEYYFEKNADKGFYSNTKKIVVITDQEIFGTLFFKSSIQNKNISKLFNGEIKIGDYIVHDLHGVGIYKGIKTQDIGGELRDYLTIEYANNDTLYVPYESLDKVSKFVGEGGEPKLTRLGSSEWDNVRTKAKKDIELIADELLDLYARRELEKGFSYDFNKATEMYDELLNDFPYDDTPDQKRSSMEILEDMKAEKPMDRLLVGDVGFGKTEIALRAAFVAVLNHKQVVVLAPTTILVSQMYKVFRDRLAKFGVNVSKVSRFEGEKRNEETLKSVTEGKIDIVIGTHRLLSSDVEFKNLGLLIIDEEQRFGVKQKERIKSLKSNLDVLSMSATPIPRTLQMSLSGIREISVITTPPKGRLPVTTQLISKNELFDPIKNELERGGQVFIVHNNIATIYSLEEKIKSKIPYAKTVVGHAKMPGAKLEKIMMDFSNKEYDILIATTIIENGIDIPTVNTMIIDDAQNFGLSQLHQLRGRVGRSDQQAFCYLVVPYTLINGKIDEKQKKKLLKDIDKSEIKAKDKEKKKKSLTIDGIERIKAIMEHQSLGSGFHIASKDLEIRGSGALLGASQSGHINSIGYEMYLRILYQEIDKKKKQLSM